MLPDPVIVVPGITASYLRDKYTLPPEAIWTVMRKQYERAVLHPDEFLDKDWAKRNAVEAEEPAWIRSDQIYEIAYRSLVDELRYELSDEASDTPVYPWGYDWRQPLDLLVEEFRATVEEVIRRTELMRNYHEDGYGERRTVNLIGHSMGGLVIAGYVKKYGKRDGRVGKVATLASPYQGSFESVIQVITGTANLGVDAPSSREREAARLTPALYHLIPLFKKGFTFKDGLSGDLFQPDLWQSSVTETLAKFVRQHGLDASDPEAQADAIFANLLQVAKTYRNTTNRLKLADVGLADDDWLCVVGADAVTRTKLTIAKPDGEVQFELSSEDRTNEWESADQAERWMTGDGTVPLAGAMPSFLPKESIVCITPDDYGYWELKDKALTKYAGFHGILPNMNMLHRLLVRHFTGKPDKRGNTWGRSLPGVSEADWKPAVWPLKWKEA